MQENLIIVDGGTFLFSDRNGDVEESAPEGFFHEDVRHLSRWCLTLDGKPLQALSCRVVDYFSTRIVAALRGEASQRSLSRATASSAKASTRTWSSRTSWSGIVDERRAARVVKRLLNDDLFSGWGTGCLSEQDAAYNPLEYHNGTVWPHDTAIVAEGMRRYGFREEAGRLCEALLRAAEAFGNQLPEVFSGLPRDETNAPVEYPNALKPQAWAAGAPLLALRTLLGLDVVNGKVRNSPSIPELLGRSVSVGSRLAALG